MKIDFSRSNTKKVARALLMKKVVVKKNTADFIIKRYIELDINYLTFAYCLILVPNRLTPNESLKSKLLLFLLLTRIHF